MNSVYLKDNDIIVEFESEVLTGKCNCSQKTFEDFKIMAEDFEEPTADEFKLVIESFCTMTKGYSSILPKTESETTGWITMINSPNTKIATDIKIQTEVKSDA